MNPSSMQAKNMDVYCKVIVVGNGQVGKTTMITRFAKGVYTDKYKKTLAVDFLEKQMVVQPSGEEINYHLWDTAGQEEYDAITRGYYKGAGVCVVAFSTTDRDSFDAVEGWVKKVRDECGDIVMVLAQTKMDLLSQAVFTPTEAEALAKKCKLRLYRTSTHDYMNVEEMFNAVGQEFIDRGGEEGLGIDSVRRMPRKDDGGAANTSAGGAQKGGEAAKADAQKSFTLDDRTPSTRRTGGKKKSGWCSVL